MKNINADTNRYISAERLPLSATSKYAK